MVFRFRLHTPVKKNEQKKLEPMSPLITENMDIIQAKTDKYGILQRPDLFTGENKNDIIDLSPPVEKKKETNENKEKFLPGERLLYTIKNEKPELLKHEYKQISTKKKTKLKSIIGKLS